MRSELARLLCILVVFTLSGFNGNAATLTPFRAPLHKTMVTLQLMISLQSMVAIVDLFFTLIGYGAVLLW